MGGGYEVLVAEDVRSFLQRLDEKSKRILTDTLSKLEEPYPGRGKGDKEQITWKGQSVYRLHIGRSWTAFYDIDEDEEVVTVRDVLPIDDAHEQYGDLD
jgi:mRNA-degrading endonuclease RelE of RelBE toxin-antitoxin system